jgi:hypothetical protein
MGLQFQQETVAHLDHSSSIITPTLPQSHGAPAPMVTLTNSHFQHLLSATAFEAGKLLEQQRLPESE